MADSLRRSHQFQYQNLSVCESNSKVSDVKRTFEGNGWREVLLPLASLFRWDKPYYPAIIVGITTFLFSIVWYIELSTLTTVSLACMIAGIFDFIVPFMGATVTGYKTWTEVEESEFISICEKIASARQNILEAWHSLTEMRQQNSKTFFFVVMGVLTLTAWVGNLIDNLFLTYIIVNGILLTPGLLHHKLTDKYLQPVMKILHRVKTGAPEKSKVN
ncbi:unnamed protein product [Candidula unifasciata]|uniref:RETREG1-3/ARL6IP-like N-terminal reticulon-homology domain-containing protein n=1 Tax=Candidula unifasciata TaxID=100452 RepID=A0A8S3ZY23_9EUPU|nr:unnamed protein product [Candidula unifasciata]